MSRSDLLLSLGEPDVRSLARPVSHSCRNSPSRSSPSSAGDDLILELKDLWDRGEEADALALLSRHPQLRANRSVVLDLAYEEFCLRREAGELPDFDQFCKRFSTVQNSLRRVLEAHQFLEENPHLLQRLQPVQWPEPGTAFLGFSLVRELGRGAFARVFLASEPALGGRSVVVKISLQGAAEAEILGRLSHPNIVPVHSVREDPVTGLTLVCMPYVGVATLCDVLDLAYGQSQPQSRARVILDAARGAGPENGAVPAHVSAPAVLENGSYVEGVVDLVVQLAEALSFIHNHGVYHRDLKPSNVLMTPNGKPMLLDFNLSSRDGALDQPLGGTLPYMAPEQLAALEGNIPPEWASMEVQSDLFSLGIILYELLTGALPFGPISVPMSSSDMRRQLAQRQKLGPTPLRQLNAGAAKGLAEVVERCLAYDPRQRPQSAAELAAALRANLSSLGAQGRRSTHRRRGVLAACALLMGAALIIGGAHIGRTNHDAQRPIDQGLAAYHQGRWEEAITHLTAAMEADPNSVTGLFARGRAHQKLGHIALALKDYEQAGALSPDGKFKACMGHCYSRLGSHNSAIARYEDAMRAGFGPTARLLNNVGYSYLRKKKFDLAKERLDRAVRLDDTLQAAYLNRALVDYGQSAKSGRVPLSGIADIEKALHLGTVTAELDYAAGWIYAFAAKSDQRWIQRAVEHLEQAVAQGENPGLLRDDPAFAPLASNPRFQSLIQLPARPNTSETPLGLVDPVQD